MNRFPKSKGLLACKSFAKSALQKTLFPLTCVWKPYSRLICVSDSSFWTISWDMREIRNIATQLSIATEHAWFSNGSSRQCVFEGSHFFLLREGWQKRNHRVATAYFHGKPGTQGFEEFDVSFSALKRNRERIQRIQVSHAEMKDVVASAGVPEENIHIIPIGVNFDYFTQHNSKEKRLLREQLGIPLNAFVVGSFQKDGEGWGEGMTPKKIKGPDVFLDTIRLLKSQIPELFVLLTGPARGYVKQDLTQQNVPFKHCFLKDYTRICDYYACLNVYLIASRQEGGPKAFLESMASGIPVVSTRVGQVMDLGQDQVNALLADPEDYKSLCEGVMRIYSGAIDSAGLIQRGIETAKANSYAAQLPRWGSFFEGFVEG